jgi:branched-chain amino acid transport system substrate-binding protein
MTSALTRRRAAAGGTAALVLSPFLIRPDFAQSATVNIGVIQPLSGANAQFGVNCRNGIELVADEINATGGIKALSGAKINLIVSDATSNPTIAPAVAQRLTVENDVTAVLGAFVSSLTLPVSEVTARADIPFLTESFADEITGRGLESVFQVVAKASQLHPRHCEGGWQQGREDCDYVRGHRLWRRPIQRSSQSRKGRQH